MTKGNKTNQKRKRKISVEKKGDIRQKRTNYLPSTLEY